LYQRLSSWSS